VINHVIKSKFVRKRELRDILPILSDNVVLSGSFLLQILQGQEFKKADFDDIDIFINESEWSNVKDFLEKRHYQIIDHKESLRLKGVFASKDFYIDESNWQRTTDVVPYNLICPKFQNHGITGVFDCSLDTHDKLVIQVILIKGPPIAFIGGTFDYDVTRHILTDKKLWICELENLKKKIIRCTSTTSKKERVKKYQERGYTFEIDECKWSKIIVFYRYIFDKRASNFIDNDCFIPKKTELEIQKMSDLDIINEFKDIMLLIASNKIKEKFQKCGDFFNFTGYSYIYKSTCFYNRILGTRENYNFRSDKNHLNRFVRTLNKTCSNRL
jgi:hypothetical protein